MTAAHDTFDPASATALPSAFFERDTRTVARELLGALLVSCSGETPTGGRIVETEAYLGTGDPGSHAATKGVTKRNAVMYGPPGRAYVYFTYGNHHMLNIVTESDGVAGAVLVRALEPLIGIETMMLRRGGRQLRDLANGPGKLAAALAIDLTDNGVLLGDGRLIVYDGARPADGDRGVSGRVGLSAGHELHLRFFWKGNAFVSPGRMGPRAAARKEGRRDS